MQKYFCLWMLLSCILISTVKASCGTAVCPIITYTPFTNKTVEFGFQYESINQDKIQGGHHDSSDEHGHQHEELKTLNKQYVINAAYQMNPIWRVRAEVPFVHRSHEHSHHHDGAEILDSWDISGLGDATVFLDHQLGDLGFSAGVKLPTGKTRLTNQEGKEAEVPIQPGTGSTDYTLGIFYQWDLVRLAASYTVSGKGTDGWRFGNRWLATVGTRFLVTHGFVLTADAHARFQDKSDTGTTGEPAENTGGTWLFLTPGFQYNLTDSLRLDSMVQIPIYQNVNGTQLIAPYNLRVGINLQI